MRQMDAFYEHLSVPYYVIMPNHIHFLICVMGKDGQSGTPVPTASRQNATISAFVSTFKRFCNKEYGKNIWQARFHDHIVRDDKDYREIAEYIENNPIRWAQDRFYCEEE